MKLRKLKWKPRSKIKLKILILRRKILLRKSKNKSNTRILHKTCKKRKSNKTSLSNHNRFNIKVLKRLCAQLSRQSLKHFYQKPAAKSAKKCSFSCWIFLEISRLLLLSSTVDTVMVGNIKISTHGVTLREEQSPCFRSKMGIALVATPVNAGSQLEVVASRRQTVAPSCLTWLAPATSLQRLLAMIYIAVATADLVSVQIMVVNSLHTHNYLMVKASATHGQINLGTKFH